MKSRKIKLLFCLAYFFSYVTRQNYSAALTEIISDMEITKSFAGIALTASFISYGSFQIVSGFFGDKFRSEKIIFFGLFGSSFINILIWLFPNIYVMNTLWCINGIFQSLIWPPLVRMIVDNLKSEEYSTTVVRVSQASYVATIAVYVLVPAIISFLDWRSVFIIFGGASMMFSFVWLFETGKLSKTCSEIQSENGNAENVPERKKLSLKFLLSVGLVPMILSTFVAGFMRDGISAWMPTYISEVYKIDSFSSILTGAVIPLCCALFLDMLKRIGEKIGNEMKAASIYFAVALTACVTLFVVFSKYPVFDVVLMSLITVCVHGVNLMLVCTVPKHFFKYGKSSTMSGILNSAVYAGSAFSAYGTAFFATSFGWKFVCGAWSCVLMLAFLLCVAWKNKYGIMIKK